MQGAIRPLSGRRFGGIAEAQFILFGRIHGRICGFDQSKCGSISRMANLANELRFPYAWSNPSLSDEKVIAAALDRAMFDDVCSLAMELGVPALRAAAEKLTPDPQRDVALERMLRNIQIGISRA